MECSLYLDAVADIARGQAAREIVLLQDKDVADAFLLKLKGGREPCESSSDNHDIIMVFIKLHFSPLKYVNMYYPSYYKCQ